MKDGPLDMRMNQNIGEDASSWLNNAPEQRDFKYYLEIWRRKKAKKESPKQLLRLGRVLKSEQQKNWPKSFLKRLQEDLMTRNILQQKHFKR